MKKRLVIVILVGMLLSLTGSVLAAAKPQVHVTANVLAGSIVYRSKGAQISNQIVGFKAGSMADFQSLTTFTIMEAGIYPSRVEIIGPDKQLRASYGWLMEAKEPNSTHNQITIWQGVNFNLPGIYQFVVRVNNVVIASFAIPASK